MNILLISGVNELKPGGVSLWTQKYLKYFEKSTDRVFFINNIGSNNGAGQNFAGRFFDNLKKAMCILKEEKIEIAHINDSCSMFGVIRDYVLSAYLKKNGVKIVVHFHCDIEDQMERWSNSITHFSERCLKKLIDNCDSIIVLSKRSQSFINMKFGRNTVIIPNFIDRERNQSKKFAVNDEIKEILFVGHVIEEKGIFELMQCADAFSDYRFKIIGESNEQIITELNKHKNIRYLGIKDNNEVFEELYNSDVFILPSRSEGFSVALLEAMSVGIPCIATDVGANSDMLENKGGVIVQAKNAKELINAIRDISKYDIRKKMSIWNIEKVNNSYDIDTVMNKYIELYKSL